MERLKRLWARLRAVDPLKYGVSILWAAMAFLVAREEYEEHREKEHACDVSLAIRAEAEGNEVQTWRRVQEIGDIDPVLVDQLVERIHEDYDALPPPADCQ